MNNIQKTALRLIANAYLFSKEKGKKCTGYRFDSSFLTYRGITTPSDMEELQAELNRRGWCFNILNFNDFVIQEKQFLAEMTKLGFNERIKGKSQEEIEATYLEGIHKLTSERITSILKQEFRNDKGYVISPYNDIDNGIYVTKDGYKLTIVLSSRLVYESKTPVMVIYLYDKTIEKDFAKCELVLPSAYSLLKEICQNIARAIRNANDQEQSNRAIEESKKY